MTIPTRQFVMSAVFGAALASAPLAPAQDAKAPTGGTSDATKRDEVKKDDNAELKKQLNNIEADVKSLQTFRKNLEDEVFGRGDGKSTADKGLLQRVTELETRLKKIEELLTQINSRLGEGKSTSAFGPAPAATTTAKSYVRVVNDYPTEMSLMINGKSHRLQPGEVKTVEVPPGSYTYELLHAGSQPITSTVKDGETVTLRIR